ncbi:MAG: DUF4097 family beta strand repeat-containing protein [Capsulimonadaceae bacterium]
MTEERLLILNMLREGKITAEQADALLRTLRDSATTTSSTASSSATASSTVGNGADAATLAGMQSKLADLQAKIGELQGKHAALHAARMAGQAAGHAAAFAGKVIDRMPRADVDFRKIIDETVSGLSSLKSDAIRTAKQAAREAAQEARRLAREGKKVVTNEFSNFVDVNGQAARRPIPAPGAATAIDELDSTTSFTGESAAIVNRYGHVTLRCGDGPDVRFAARKTAWGATEAEARLLLQQVFLATKQENGALRLELIAPVDAGERVVADCTVIVPAGLRITVETTHGNISAEDVGPGLIAKSISGAIRVSSPREGAGDTRLATRNGAVEIIGWRVDSGEVTAQTVSGDIRIEGLAAAGDVVLNSHSGDLTTKGLALRAGLTAESLSGDIAMDDSSVSTSTQIKSQSGGIVLKSVRAGQAHVESMSGAVRLENFGGAVSIKTVSGDVQLLAIDSYAVAVNSVSGDATITYAGPLTGSLAGTSVNGDIHVSLPEGSDTRIDLSTSNGKVECALALEDKTTAHTQQISGRIGAGAGSLRLQSVSGDLAVVGASAPL